MFRNFAALAVISFACAPALAASPAADGARVRLDVVMTYDENTTGKTDISQSKSLVKRTLKGMCVLEAAGVMPYGIAGPTAAEERAMSTPNAGMATLEREAAKCGGDQACLMRLAQKMAGSDLSAGSAPEGGYQIWHPFTCEGDFSTDENHWLRIYEPMAGWLESTTLIKGAAKIPPIERKGWEAARIEHNLKTNTTAYWFAMADGQPATKEVIGPGASRKTEKVRIGLANASLPTPFHTIAGPPKGGKATQKVDKGVVTIEWTLTKL
jgi:hypothetical protein